MKKNIALTLCLLGTSLAYAQETLQTVYDRGNTISSTNLPNINFVKAGTLNWHIGNGVGSSDNSFRFGNDVSGVGTILKMQSNGESIFSFNVTAPSFTGYLNGNALSATNWGGRAANWDSAVNDINVLAARGADEIWRNVSLPSVKNWLGLGSSAYFSAHEGNEVSSVVKRTVDGDINVRLLRSEYPADIGTTGNYFLTQNSAGAGSDNYAKPMSMAAVKSAMGINTSVLSTGYSVAGIRIGFPSNPTEYLMDASGIKEYLGIPSGGETLQSITTRAATSNNVITLNRGGYGSSLNIERNGFRRNEFGVDINYNGFIHVFNSSEDLDSKIQGKGVTFFNVGTSSGNVGVGTASPLSKFHLVEDANTSGAPNNAQLLVGGKTNPEKHISLAYNTSSNYGEIQSQAYDGGYTSLVFNPNGGNVGIGTATPTQKLEVNGHVKAISFIGELNGTANSANLHAGWGQAFGTEGTTLAGIMGIDGLTSNYQWYSPTKLRTILGMPSGGETLQSITDRGFTTTNNIGIGGAAQSGGGGSNWLTLHGNAYSGGMIYSMGGSPKVYSFVLNSFLNTQTTVGIGQKFIVNDNLDAMVMLTNGNIGIGTPTTTAGVPEKLSVNGKIMAKEIKVQPTGWPDYVFTAAYKPKTLAEIEAFINSNQHLPEIPSATEVEKNGVELGEMNKLLLKKIEELTLLMIEQSKIVQEMRSEIKKLKEKK